MTKAQTPAQGAENLTRNVFVERFGHLLPEYVNKILNSDDQPGNFNFVQECHLNFSQDQVDESEIRTV